MHIDYKILSAYGLSCKQQTYNRLYWRAMKLNWLFSKATVLISRLMVLFILVNSFVMVI